MFRQCVVLCFILFIRKFAAAVAAYNPYADKRIFADQTDDKFQDECLKWHNHYRSMHLTGNMELDKQAIRAAMNHSTFYNGNGLNRDNDRVGYGINKFYSIAPTVAGCREAAKKWYDGVEKYDWKKHAFNWEAGSFTQLIWKSSTQLGCARAVRRVSKNSRYPDKWWEAYIVCAYHPPGNVLGSFKENVYPNQATIYIEEAAEWLFHNTSWPLDSAGNVVSGTGLGLPGLSEAVPNSGSGTGHDLVGELPNQTQEQTQADEFFGDDDNSTIVPYKN